jgi:predicted HTH domain antitoxin
VKVDLDDELVALLELTQKPLEKATREAVVLDLYRRGTLSSGKAAEILGMQRFEFVRYASELGIPYFRMTREQWESEKAASDSL